MNPQPAGLLTTVWHELGEGHAFKFLIWSPDFSLAGNAKWAHLVHLINTQPIVGASIRHSCRTETGLHEGAIHFKTELTVAADGFKDDAMWDVECWEPLTISPSLLVSCPCNDHGHIKKGKWVRA